MKTITLLLIFCLGVFLGCTPPEDSFYKYSSYKPLLMTRAQLEKSVLWQAPREPKEPGKIYTKGKYIFINEKYKGVHVIDNSDPTHPVNTGFIQAPGNVDMAVKGNALYLDNAVDLITVDITDPKNLKVTSRIEEVFPELAPPDNPAGIYQYSKEKRPDNTVIIGWEKQLQN